MCSASSSESLSVLYRRQRTATPIGIPSVTPIASTSGHGVPIGATPVGADVSNADPVVMITVSHYSALLNAASGSRVNATGENVVEDAPPAYDKCFKE